MLRCIHQPKTLRKCAGPRSTGRHWPCGLRLSEHRLQRRNRQSTGKPTLRSAVPRGVKRGQRVTEGHRPEAGGRAESDARRRWDQ